MYGPFVNPYPKGIKLMSAREADECARHGEVLRWSTDDEEDKVESEVQLVTETENAREMDARERQLDSDTSESTAENFKAPSTAE
jgi:hypothetical protein